MNRFALPLLVLIAAGLAGLAVTEMVEGPDAPPAPGGAAVAAAAAPGLPQLDPAPGQVAALLARPPFSPDRRPDPVANGTDPRLPRLTGISVANGDKRAIFAGPNGARSAVLGQGDQIGVYRVQTISPAEVVLAGPEGAQTVRPTFSAAPPSGLATPPPLTLPPPGILNLPPFPAAPQAAVAGQGRSP